MAWFNRKTEKKSSQVASAIVNLTYKQPIWTSTNYTAFADEGYMDNPYVYACINLITKSCAQIPFTLYQVASDGSRKEIEKHVYLDLLAKPNPQQGGSEFIKQMISYKLLADNAFVERVGPNDLNRPPKELYNLRPDRVHIHPSNTHNMIDHYSYYTGQDEITLKYEQVMHLKDFNPLNDWEGMTPLRAAAKSVDQNNECKKWNVAFLQNGCNENGIIFSETDLGDEEFEALETQLKQRASNTSKAGTPMLFTGKLKWQPTSVNPKDINWIEATKQSAREICIAYGVPSELLGDSTNKTYSNYQEARKAFYMETILPIMDMLCDAFNAWLTPLYGNNLVLSFDKESISALQEDTNQLIIALAKATFLTDEEKRAMLGYESNKNQNSNN